MQEHWLISHKNKNPLTEKEKWVSGATSGIREREERKKWKRKSEINTVLAPSNRVELPSWLAAKIYGKCLLQFLLTSPGASLVDHMVKNLSAMQETQVPSLGQADPLEKEMATYSNILAWRTPWTEEPDELQSMGSQRVGHGLHPSNRDSKWRQKPGLSSGLNGLGVSFRVPGRVLSNWQISGGDSFPCCCC